MGSLCSIADEHGLKVVEDAAQAIGIKRNGKPCGTFGDIGCFSFFADKTITMGEGGLVITKDEEVYHKLLYLRNQGRLNRGSFLHPEIGYNFRITDMQAAVGLAQLKKLPDIVNRKHNIFRWYEEGLKGISKVSIYKPTTETNPFIPFRVVIETEGPATDLMDHMSKEDIETRSFFVPLHRQPCYNTELTDAEFPVSVDAFEHGVCLPSYASIDRDKVMTVCKSIREFYDV